MPRRCMICVRPDAKEINLVLLSCVHRRDGTVNDLAAKLGCDRSKLWKHRKYHVMGQAAPTRKERLQKRSRLSFQARAWELSEEMRRLGLQAANGMAVESAQMAFKILQSRKGLLEMECRLETGISLKEKLKQAGRKAGEVNPDEEREIVKQYTEICLAPEPTWERNDNEESDGAVDADAGVAEAEDARDAAS
jgi:hypothetical protein